MSEVKTFKVTGEVKKPRATIPFSIQIRATKEEDALERLYTDLGSRHKARRLEIKLNKIEQIKIGEMESAESGK